MEVFLIIKWEEFPVLIDLISLITPADFNRLSIDLKLVIIDFRISADSQPYILLINSHLHWQSLLRGYCNHLVCVCVYVLPHSSHYRVIWSIMRSYRYNIIKYIIEHLFCWCYFHHFILSKLSLFIFVLVLHLLFIRQLILFI